MSREIKFRALRKDDKTGFDGRWLYGGIHFQDGTAFIALVGMRLLEVHKDTVGQFTGLLDKNDKEIYEGDIVKTVDGYPATVEYDTNKAEYNPFGSGEYAEWGDGVEVIGNIWESPELLEGGDHAK